MTIENRSYLIPSNINIYFTDSTKMSTIKPELPVMNYINIESDFSIQYRGIYRVGIDKIECIDLLNIIYFNKSFWPRTFYVYPKINPEYDFLSPGAGSTANNIKVKSREYKTYLESIDKYKIGSKSSDISWKHFAATGEPYIKKYNSDEISDCYIFLDRTKLSDIRKGRVDDTAIEIFVSILHSNISKQITSYIDYEAMKIDNPSIFNNLYKETIYINFDKESYKVYLKFLNQNYNKDCQLIIITTMENDHFLDIEMLLSFSQLTLILVTGNLAYNDENQRKINLLKKIENKVNIIWVN